MLPTDAPFLILSAAFDLLHLVCLLMGSPVSKYLQNDITTYQLQNGMCKGYGPIFSLGTNFIADTDTSEHTNQFHHGHNFLPLLELHT